MASTTESTLSLAGETAEAPRAHVGQLTPVLSERCVLQPGHVGVCLVFAVLFLAFSYLPLPVGGLWRHLAAGEFMLSRHTLPQESLLLPLAVGRPATDTAWLSEVLLAATYRWEGLSALSCLFTLATTGALVLLAGVYFRQTRRKRFAVAGVLFTVALGWGWLTVLRPETFGFVCLAGLLALLSADSRWQPVTPASSQPRQAWLSWSLWIGVPLVLALWANFDRSFVVGIIILAAWSIGNLVDQARARGFSQALQDPGSQKRLVVLELSLLATLFNPLGLDLWLATLGMATESLGSVPAFGGPLVLASLSGFLFAGACLTAGLLLRRSPRSLTSAEVLLFVVTAGAACWNSAWLVWFAPLAALVLVPHLAAALGVSPAKNTSPVKLPTREDNPEEVAQPKQFQFAFTLICGLVIWAGFALSPLATPLLGGKARQLDRLLGNQTPLGVSAWLEQQATPQLVWSAPDWSDFLAFRRGVPVLSGSEFVALPDQVRYDNLQISQGHNWASLADRYAVDLLVIDKARHGRMVTAARRADAPWAIAYEDDQALVLRRQTARPTVVKQAAPAEVSRS